MSVETQGLGLLVRLIAVALGNANTQHTTLMDLAAQAAEQLKSNAAKIAELEKELAALRKE